MKKQYIIPSIKSVNVMINESMMLTGSLGNDETDSMGSNRLRSWGRSEWGNGWDED